MTADDQLLGTLQTLANGSGSQAVSTHRDPTIGAQTTGAGCLAMEAAAALADNSAGNASAFTTDIANLFQDSQTSPACMQPGAAIAAAGTIDGASAAALAILSQSSNSQLAPVVPGQALAYADLGPAGQLIGIGVALAQTSGQALQAVVGSIESFNQAAGGQLGTLIMNTQGPVLQSYMLTSQAATSLDQTVQQFDGAYSGSFTGNEYVTIANCPTIVVGPISGTLDFSASGGSITTTAPGAGIGTVDDSSGIASFTIAGLADASVTCTFNGHVLGRLRRAVRWHRVPGPAPSPARPPRASSPLTATGPQTASRDAEFIARKSWFTSFSLLRQSERI